MLGDSHHCDVVREADDTNIAIEVEAQDSVVHNIPQNRPEDRPLRDTCCDFVGLRTIVRGEVEHSCREVAGDDSQQVIGHEQSA
uniref:Uncharacterized protein n=1 Tax=Trichogramma kaykai TaxID=54128 RepID=A0ABD2X5D5_9HYME